MGERVVSIKIVAAAESAVRGFNAVRDAAAETKAKVVDSAKSQRAEWSTVGAGLTAVGVAITGIGLAALKTGIQYNTLQQTTRAALTTLLGSAQAANAQMDKLDEFARNSPFSKATFITAQQQMLAFGIETQKVIPYLDAVQNAVAAAGGNNQQIAEIAFIMSQISSAGKITAQDLMQFGQRGVNAAELIGSQMGKTGAQIRNDITAGTLDANKALDALAAGMQAKYEGAAANVKNTFEGAMDRVKAAWRDFASELAKPLVDPNGGGALVDLLNWTADAMRNFEKLPEPVKATVSALTGLVGVGSLVGGTFMLALPKVLEFQAALATLGLTGGAVRSGLGNIVRFLGGPWGIALMAAAASVAIFNNVMDASKASAATLETSIKQNTGALSAMQETARENEKGLAKVFVDVESQLENLGPLLDKAATSGRGFWSSLTLNEQAAMDVISEFGTSLASLASTDLPRAQEEFKRFGEEANLSRENLATALGDMPGFKDALIDYADSAGLATDDTTLLKIALGEIDPAAEASKNSLEGIQGVAIDTSDAVAKLADEILNFGKTQIDADRAAIALRDSYRDLEELFSSGEVALDGYSEASDRTEEQLLKTADAARKSAASILEASGDQDAANAVLDEARQKLVDQRIALGENAEAAQAWANERIPTAEAVSKALDGVAESANSIPGDTKANVTTDAPIAGGRLSAVDTIARNIPGLVRTKVFADTDDAYARLQAIRTQLGSIASGAIATVTSALGGKAYGGTVGYAQGGTILKAATGMTVPGLGGGVADGTVWGRGTSKSDSVLVRLSKGEEVIQEPYASMNRPLLKSINRGDFVPSMMQPQVVVSGGGGSTTVNQTNNVAVAEKDPRLLMRQFGRQIKGALT